MNEPTPQKKGFLSGLIGDIGVNTEVGLSQSAITQTAAALFIAGFLIILAFFVMKKYFK